MLVILKFFLLLVALSQPHVWPHGPVLNQGSTPRCVGYAWVGWGTATRGAEVEWPDADTLYFAAKGVDGLPIGTAGTTLEAAGAILLAGGQISRVTYTNDVDDAELFLATRGPIIVASTWYNPALFDGHLWPSVNDGNHAYWCYGIVEDGRGPDLLCQNSWGDTFGEHGTFRVRPAVLAGLPYHEFALPDKPGEWNTSNVRAG